MLFLVDMFWPPPPHYLRGCDINGRKEQIEIRSIELEFFLRFFGLYKKVSKCKIITFDLFVGRNCSYYSWRKRNSTKIHVCILVTYMWFIPLMFSEKFRRSFTWTMTSWRSGPPCRAPSRVAGPPPAPRAVPPDPSGPRSRDSSVLSSRPAAAGATKVSFWSYGKYADPYLSIQPFFTLE